MENEIHKKLLPGGIGGYQAILSNISAANAIASKIRSTYGPRGKDKLICDEEGNLTVTNGFYEQECLIFIDGATLLKLLNPSHPIAKLLVKLSISQDLEVGDGTTSVVLLCSSLLQQSLSLINEGIQPNIIIKGFKIALNLALKEIEKLSNNNINDEILKKILCVPLNSKLLFNEKEYFANLLLQCKEFQKINLFTIPGGSLKDSNLINGIIFKRPFSYAGVEQQPKFIKNPKILLLNYEIELKNLKEFAHLSIDSKNYSNFINAEYEIVFKKLEIIKNLKCDLILNLNVIGDLATQYFAQNGITCYSRISSPDMEMIQKCTNGIIQSTLDNLNADDPIFGTCEIFEEKTINDERYCLLLGCPTKEIITFLIRGGSDEILGEAKRSLYDAICVFENINQYPSFLLGGGATEMQLKMRLYDASKLIKNALIAKCVQSYGNALEDLIIAICENAGLDSLEILSKLRHLHSKNESKVYGIDIQNGKEGDMSKLGIYEPSNVKTNSLIIATECACTILNIDYNIIMPQEESEKERTKRITQEMKKKKQAQKKWNEFIKSIRKELI